MKAEFGDCCSPGRIEFSHFSDEVFGLFAVFLVEFDCAGVRFNRLEVVEGVFFRG